jgi:Iron-sulfur cluster binding domain of dihydroorotate dehydrogenase B
MAAGSGTITELRMEPDGLSARITCPPGLRPAPGQYLVANGPDPCQPLPVVLFPSGMENGELRIAPPLPESWGAGMELALRGPLGHGFHVPPTARRIALASLDSTPARLLPLAALALAQRAAVAIYAKRAPARLPAEVEVLPLDLLPEAPIWAEFLALDVSLSGLPGIRSRLGLSPFQHLSCPTQVLVIAPMPCSGTGECGVCAVTTQHGWALACMDGPVFDFNQLEGA